MTTLQKMRNDIKDYIDEADEQVVRLVYALLESESTEEWWHSIPDEVRRMVEESINQADKGVYISHGEVKARYPEWFTK